MARVTMIDPPSGWLYGFPRVYNKPENQSFESWMLEKGYPQKEIDSGMLKWCRFWEQEISAKSTT